MKALVLGDGLLGSEIVKQTGWDYLSNKKDNIDAYDIRTISSLIPPDVTTIINCIGNTDTYSHEREEHWNVNYKFVVVLYNFCREKNIKLVHISTDYIYTNSKRDGKEEDIPVHQETWYSYAKLLSDGYMQLWGDNYLLIRCSFKPTPFPYKKAFDNVIGKFDYVDVISEQIIGLVNDNVCGVLNIGTTNKSIYELAIKTVPDIGQWHNDRLPSIKMNIDKFEKLNEKKV